MSNKENSDLSNVPLSSDSEHGELSTFEIRHQNFNKETFSGNTAPLSLDPDSNPEDEEEKQRLIAQVLERQNTLDDLSSRVDSVKVENLKLKSENQVLGQYIENLMAASSVFQSASPKAKKK